MSRMPVLLAASTFVVGPLAGCGEPDEVCAYASAPSQTDVVADGGLVVELHLDRADWYWARVQVENLDPDDDCVVAVYQGHTVPPAEELEALAPGEAPPEALSSGAIRVEQANLAAHRAERPDGLWIDLGAGYDGIDIAQGTVFSVLACAGLQAEATVVVDMETCDGDPLSPRQLLTRHR
mgnify:CR=1 FL=1